MARARVPELIGEALEPQRGQTPVAAAAEEAS
jgi:hypothetical protein